MKVHFIYPDVSTEVYHGVHHGLASLSAMLKAHKHQVSLHHIVREVPRKVILDRIQEEEPDLVCFSSTTNQFPYVETFSRWIKQSFDLPILAGGVHATIAPDKAMEEESIDIICRGEGEYALLELLDQWGGRGDWAAIQNLWVRKNGDIIRNAVRPLIDDLDSLPFPDYEIFNFKKLLKTMRGTACLIAGRGCPYGCTYCCNSAIREVYQGKGRYVRWRSVDNVLEQAEFMIKNYEVSSFYFEDDTFTLSREWLFEFCEKWVARIRYPFKCNTRVDRVNRETLTTLKKAGCVEVAYGIESGDETMRKAVLNRDITNEQIVNAFRISHEVGLKTQAYNMIGLPSETPEMVERTIELNRLVSPDSVSVFFFYPYPNTELWEICKEKGYLKANEYLPSYRSGSILSLPDLTEKQLRRYYDILNSLAEVQAIRRDFPLLYLPYIVAHRIFGKNLGKILRKLRHTYPFNVLMLLLKRIGSLPASRKIEAAREA